MSQQTINIGTTPDDGTGDTGRDSFDKCNDNFTELYDLTDLIGSTTPLEAGSAASVITLSRKSSGTSADYVLLDLFDSTADIYAPTKITPQGSIGVFTVVDKASASITLDPFGGSMNVSNTELIFYVNNVKTIGINDAGKLKAYVTGATVGEAGNQFSVVYTEIVSSGAAGSLAIRSTAGVDIQNAITDKIGMYGATAVVQATAMTAADANTPNSGDATTDAIIANLQTRVNELEAMLDATTGIGIVA